LVALALSLGYLPEYSSPQPSKRRARLLGTVCPTLGDRTFPSTHLPRTYQNSTIGNTSPYLWEYSCYARGYFQYRSVCCTCAYFRSSTSTSTVLRPHRTTLFPTLPLGQVQCTKSVTTLMYRPLGHTGTSSCPAVTTTEQAHRLPSHWYVHYVQYAQRVPPRSQLYTQGGAIPARSIAL
jgi:hypothetical protein